MGLRINTNILSLNAQRNLASTSKALGRSLERLSSGTRINRAGDDAAGLAISEGLKSQVRGLRQAVRNANDSLGFLNTAEGALAEITNITQRLRELAIQAANGALGNRERGFLNDEMENLLEEFNRIAIQTEFNGTKLLDGSFVETDLQVGVNKGETISFTVGDARTSSLGALAIRSGAQNNLREGFELRLGAENTLVSVGSDLDTVSFQGRGYSALAISKAINQVSGTTGVRADVLDTVLRVNQLNFDDAPASLQEDELTINNVSIVGSIANMADFLSTVNSFASSTGVRARLVAGSTTDIELFAADGRNINLGFAAGGALSVAPQVWGLFVATANHQGAETLNRLFSVGGTASGGIVGSSLTFTGAIQLSSSKTIIIGGTTPENAVGFQNSVVVVDPSNAIFSISISEQGKAQDALATIDATLSQLNELRSKLGAVQNRLESTIRNLSIGLENISSAESQIKDADIAAETAELTRAQILQQAGIAVLGQANTASQVALQLLQF
jgi:flagellin